MKLKNIMEDGIVAFRRIPHKNRVEAVLECIEIKNIKETAKKRNISESTLIGDCNDVLLEVDEILKKRNLVEKSDSKLMELIQELVIKVLKIILRIKLHRSVRAVIRKT